VMAILAVRSQTAALIIQSLRELVIP